MAKKMFPGQAMARAVELEMNADNSVILLGEDLINMGGGAGVFRGLAQKFPERVFDMPIAENGFTHFGIGAALSGMRPIIDIMFSDFSAVCADAIINDAPKHRFMTLGEKCVPAVIFAADGGPTINRPGHGGNGANHDQSVMGWFTNVPGLKIVAPYCAQDAYSLMRSSIRDNDPVLFLFPLSGLGTAGEVDEDVVVTLNNAANIIQEGTDVTIVAIQSSVPTAIRSLDMLKEAGISAELIDPRVISPFDYEAVYKSVKKTGRLIIIHEAHKRGGFGGEIAASVAENCFEHLKAPIRRLGALNCPIPSGYMEWYMLPHEEDILKAAKEICK